MICYLKIVGFIIFLLGVGMLLGLVVPCSTFLLSAILIGIGIFIILK